VILTKLRFENQQKKCQLYPNKKASFLFELALFQLFVDLFVTQTYGSSNFLSVINKMNSEKSLK